MRELFIPQPCTKRKQGYKELVLHLATQHQLLKEVQSRFAFISLCSITFPGYLWLKHFPDQVMAKDKRPGVAAVFAALYEDKEQVNWNSFINFLLLALRLRRWKTP